MTSFGDFTYDPEARTLRGLLLPFGEASRMNATGHEGVAFSADTIDLPRDPSVVTLNREHDRHDPVGRATVLEKRDEGVYSEFQLADTDEADDWLSRQKDNLRKLSAEVRFAADKVHARLTGAALVTEGAFASAGLFALAAEEPTDTPADEADPEEETPSEETNTEGDDVLTDIATLPEGVTPAGADRDVDLSASALFSALAQYGKNGDTSGLFAISAVNHAGPSAVTIGADVQDPAYLGELWARRGYVRKYISLVDNRSLTSFKVDGWRWVTEPAVGAYAGNGAEIPSAAVDTEPVTATARRIAGGHKIDRRFADFGDQAVIESYFRLMAESYAKVSDLDILAKIVAAATVTTPGAVPSGVAKGLSAIVDGALGVISTDNTPTYAIVSPELWRDIVLTGDKDVLGYLNAGFGLEAGTVEGFSIVPGAVGTGKVIVGAKEALTAFELPGSPIRVEGISPHNGTIDPALYGYLADITNNAAAIRTVTIAV